MNIRSNISYLCKNFNEIGAAGLCVNDMYTNLKEIIIKLTKKYGLVTKVKLKQCKQDNFAIGDDVKIDLDQKVTYKKLLESKKKEFKISQVRRSTETKASKEFWEIINNFKGRPVRQTNQIDIDSWYEFYRKSFPERSAFNVEIQNNFIESLDTEIT